MARRITAWLVGIVCVMVAATAGAQERFGGLTGTVIDSTKAAVPGATVTARNKETGATREVVTGADGTYRVPDLDPGRYSATIELQGFQKVQLDDVIVLLGKMVGVDAELKTGQFTEVITVTADSTKQLDLASVVLQHNVTAEEIDRIPKSRSFQSIAVAAPGVNAGEIEGGFQVNGASGAENVFTIDGVAKNGIQLKVKDEKIVSKGGDLSRTEPLVIRVTRNERGFLPKELTANPAKAPFTPAYQANILQMAIFKMALLPLAFACFLLGRPFTTQTPEGIPLTFPRANRWGAYAGDDFKVGPKLTLNLGDDIPVPSTTFLPLVAGGVATSPSVSFNYRSVGVNIAATPRVTLEGDRPK